MKRILFAALFCAVLAGDVIAQTGNASLGGIVQDPTKALIPGVAVTAKNIDTAVTSTQLTNDVGVYNFPVLQPGKYEVSAELNGFKKSLQKAELPYAGQVRVNFTLELGASNQTVEITAEATSSLRESSASVGDVLTADKITTLPLVGNNVLDLLETMPGLRTSPNGDAFDTVNGLGIDTINVTRDGLSINDGRYAAGSTTGGAAITGKGRYLLSDTTLSPDLVGEIRLILSPVDAELGRGNSQIEIRTRSGTNKYSGAATWNVRNSALDANSWVNNHTPFTDPNGFTSNRTEKPWRNSHQYTVSLGGPVQIPHLYDGKNKTFFFTLWQQTISNTRQVVYTNVLTDTARQGIYRYFPGFAPMGYNVNTAIPNQTLPVATPTASWVAVDYLGNPVAPPGNPNGTPYTSKLTCFSVFGNRKLDANGNMVPFTASDCPNGTAVVPSSSPAAGGVWDIYRPSGDNTGYIKRLLAQMPHANFFGALDGLNLAQYAFLQHRGGSTNSANAQQITDPNANSKQINIKIDHNFSPRHKAAFNYTYQRDDSDGNVSAWADGPSGWVLRRPHVFTANVTSTLSPQIVNEARFGINRNYNSTVPAYLSPHPDVKADGEKYLLPGGASLLNPDYTYLIRLGSSAGRVGSGAAPLNTGTSTSWTKSVLYSYGDTLSWSKGKHVFKFGGELRLPRNAGNGGADPYPSVSLGNNSSQTISPFNTAGNFPELNGLINSALPVNGVTTSPRTDVQNLLYFLNGSVNQASQFYYIKNFSNITDKRWDDYSTTGIRMKNQILREWSAFVKDDFKVSRRLTLNLGVRWEFYASPYIEGGLTATIGGSGYGAFGTTRTSQSTLDQFNQDPFAYWLRPGNVYLTGYGTNPFAAGLTPEDCKIGVQQNALLPASTCDPTALSGIQFVGPDSPNPKEKAIPEQYGNFGPAIGFAYELPWFGEGKTTIRGGYQQTFQRLLVNNSGEANGTDTFIGQIPGSQATFMTNTNDQVFQNIIAPPASSGIAPRAITLADMANLVPVRPTNDPGVVIPIGARSQAINGIYDSNYKGPYTQNMNLSVTRQIAKNYSLDVRYTGTLGRRLDSGINLNQPNVYHNPELLQALLDARAGTCTANAAGYQSYRDAGISPCDVAGDPVLLDQMLAGLNLNPGLSGTTGTGTFGNVGTVNAAGVFQSGAVHLRRSGTLQSNLANGDFNSIFTAITGNLLTLAPTGLQTLPTDPSTGQLYFGTTNHPSPSQRTLRNSCDRMGNGSAYVQQTITVTNGVPVVTFNPGFNASNSTPLRCFPENYLTTNPQFGNITYHANFNNSYYHSMQASLTARPINGISLQGTWVWSKAMGLQGTFVDPSNRNLNYSQQPSSPHSYRMNGTVELPIGPNKLVLGNSSGWIARAVERWQTSFILSAANATRASALPGLSHFYGNPGYIIASTNWRLPGGDFKWEDGAASGSLYGNAFINRPDPQCTDPTQVAAADKMGTNLQASTVCTIQAVAKRNSDGTPGEVMLQYSKPGEVGTLGFGNFKTIGNWSLDMSASKSFRASESVSIQIRIDTNNVLNHPTPAIPSFAAGTFGVSSTKTDERSFQGQLRISF